jgi:plastocyanin
MRTGGLITILALLALAAPADAATVQVNIGGTAFTPGDITITQGDTVTWNWVGPDTNHSTTTFAEGQTTWDSDLGNPSPNHAVGDKFSWNFPFAGTFSYFCKVHSFMNGTIRVVPKTNNPNPPSDTVAPAFASLKINLKRRRITFKLSEAADVVAIMRGPIRKTKRFTGKAGTNVYKLPKRLKKGRYGVNLTATDEAGNESLVARAKFTIG